MSDEATSTEHDNAGHSAAVNVLAPHLITLAQEASQQLSIMSVALDTNLFLDRMLEPEHIDYSASIFAPLPQLRVLKQALNVEMQRQVKALAHTTDALCVCADAVVDWLGVLDEKSSETPPEA